MWSKTLRKYCLTIAALALVTIVFGTLYIGLQQSLRASANDPQIQLAEDMANALNVGATPGNPLSITINIQTSLSPFIIIYNLQGQPVSGNGYLHGRLPVIPPGVLGAARGKTYHTVTWQPQNDVRIASVSVAAKNYFVVSGRNLKEVEARERRMLEITGLGWAVSMGVIVVGSLLSSLLASRRQKN